jgi:hypothetical protein
MLVPFLELGVGGEKSPPVAGTAGQHHHLAHQQAHVERLGYKDLLRKKSAASNLVILTALRMGKKLNKRA